MDAKQAKALRDPFPPATVGKLPKPYKADSPKGTCKECGGYHGLPAVHLDYVGHAACTDRLLQVDPDWNWEPLATDERGLPALDSKGNLWIRLTVAGVTRIGVGDGPSAKVCIGDAIRNAAMRFGVALDLWAKEDLQAMDTERGTGTEPEPPAPTRTMSRTTRTPTPAPDEPDGITPAQLKKMAAGMRDAGITERGHALAYVAQAIGREVESRNDLTREEASRVIEALETPDGPSDADWDAMGARAGESA